MLLHSSILILRLIAYGRQTNDSQNTYLTGVYLPALASDDRSPCPALNSLSNHGFINRDGRNISDMSLQTAMIERLGVSDQIANFFGSVTKDFKNEWGNINLNSLREHNKIEHGNYFITEDASMTRYDQYNSPEYYWKVDKGLVDQLKNYSTNGIVLTKKDIGRYRRARYEHSVVFNCIIIGQ